MDWVNIAFYLFSAVAVAAAGAVISVRHPVYAVLCLILTFFPWPASGCSLVPSSWE